MAQRAEALGFRDLWVTENTLDHVMCFDPVVALTYAAAVTSRIRLGASVVVLAIHSPLLVAHQWATLDYVSNGRAILGVGLGREHHYRQFEVPEEGRVRRFREEVELIRALWTQPKVDYHGQLLSVGGRHDVAQAGAVAAADLDGRRASRTRCGARRRSPMAGWGRAGRASPSSAGRCRCCARRWRRRDAIRRRSRFRSASSWRWTSGRSGRARNCTAGSPRCTTIPPGTDASGIHGTPEQVREKLEAVIAMGANHLLLNPVSRYAEQVEALAEVVGLS